MKAKTLFFLFYTLVTFSSFAQSWSWAKSAGSNDYEVALSSCIDGSGNLYVTGYFNSPFVSFDALSVTNADTSKSHADNSDVFVVKYDNAGNVIWAKSAGGNKSDQASCVRTDVLGNVFVAGHFKSSSITFGKFVLSNSGRSDMFIVKYDANGEVLWAKSEGNEKEDQAAALALDKSGNCFVTGTFESAKIGFGTDTLYNYGYTPAPKSNTVFGSTLANKSDIFLVKYDKDGKTIWSKSVGGKYSDLVSSISVDAFNSIYIAGYFKSPVIIFGIDTLMNADTTKVMFVEEGNFNSDDLFLAKYDVDGNALWAKKSLNSKQDDIAKAIATDAAGNVFVTGFFESPSIRFGALSLTNKSADHTSDMFLVKYDSEGNVIWVKNSGSVKDDEAKSLAVDSVGNCFVTGSFYGASIAFGGTKLANKTPGLPDLFVVKYNAEGNISWANSAGGKGYDEVQSIAIDRSGNCYVAGAFIESAANFNTIKLSNAGMYDLFIAKLTMQ